MRKFLPFDRLFLGSCASGKVPRIFLDVLRHAVAVEVGLRAVVHHDRALISLKHRGVNRGAVVLSGLFLLVKLGIVDCILRLGEVLELHVVRPQSGLHLDYGILSLEVSLSIHHSYIRFIAFISR